MSDDERLRHVMRAGVPEPPVAPAYGARLTEVARRRRTLHRVGVVGGAVVATAAVVAGALLVAGTPPPPQPQPRPPVASPPPGTLDCEDRSTARGPARHPTMVRLCLRSRDARGETLLVPADVLVGDRAAALAAALKPLAKPISCPHIRIPGPAYRVAIGYADGSRRSVTGCNGFHLDREGRVTGVLRTFLRLVDEQRAELGPPDSTPGVDCPTSAEVLGSTLGADFPQPGEPGLQATLCRYRYQDDEPRLVDSVTVDDPTSIGRLVLLASGSSTDPCQTIRVAPPKYDDRVLLVDQYGDVVVASAFVCAPYQVEGQQVWPKPQLQLVVHRLLRE